MESKSYYLREIQPNDIHHIHQGLSHSEITQYYAVHFDTLEQTKEQMEWYQKLRDEDTGIWWVIFEKQTNIFCGAGGFNNWDKKKTPAKLGFGC